MKSVQEAPLAHYVREYSALPGLQQAHRVEYTLRRSDTMLCFSARRSSEAAPSATTPPPWRKSRPAGCCAICTRTPSGRSSCAMFYRISAAGRCNYEQTTME